MKTIFPTILLALIASLNSNHYAMARNAQVDNHEYAIARADAQGRSSPSGETDNHYIAAFLRSFGTQEWLDLKVRREAGNRISLGYRIKDYQIDEKLRPYYPSGINKVIGPDLDGFLVRISIAPHNSLPMTRKFNRYTERIEQRPYWNLRTYGFELKDGCLVVGIEEGKKSDPKSISRVEHKIAAVVETID